MKEYKLVENVAELVAILELQRQNLVKSVSAEVQIVEGFVTAEYDLPFMEKMHETAPSVIAVEGGQVVGYCLAMQPILLAEVAQLAEFFQILNRIPCAGRKLSETSYIVMGQVCVAASHRRQGVFRGLYHFFKQVYQSQFDWLVTDVNLRNQRSISAHYAIGFEPLQRYTDAEGQHWEVIAWNLKA